MHSLGINGEGESMGATGYPGSIGKMVIEMEDKREDCQNYSMLYHVPQLYAHSDR